MLLNWQGSGSNRYLFEDMDVLVRNVYVCVCLTAESAPSAKMHAADEIQQDSQHSKEAEHGGLKARREKRCRVRDLGLCR